MEKYNLKNQSFAQLVSVFVSLMLLAFASSGCAQYSARSPIAPVPGALELSTILDGPQYEPEESFSSTAFDESTDRAQGPYHCAYLEQSKTLECSGS
ncbi:MAG: hypothetical protein IPJ88_02870 [Myxococcales bacterium]|nr:MAG: hypothetical protein IPJ88_02870 [Myxococcales bacterium]